MAVVCLVLNAALAFGWDGDKDALPPPVLLEGGRKLQFVRSFSSELEVKKNKKSFFSKVVDFVLGPAEIHRMQRPFGIAIDSRHRAIVTDPASRLVHIFDFEKKKYQKLEGSGKQDFRSPVCVAVDGADNIYISDSEVGKIFVFDAKGKFRRYIGDIHGEGFFKRPTGIGIDSAGERIYVTDTLRDAVYIADLKGNILKHFGQRGEKAGEFNNPTQVLWSRNELVVVDAMNFRVQLFDSNGNFKSAFGKQGTHTGSMFRSKGLAVDSEGDLYLADAFLDAVQVFNREGDLLYFFGQQGSQAAQFQLPAGVWIDDRDQVYVVDSFNRRVQVFQYTAAPKESGGVQ